MHAPGLSTLNFFMLAIVICMCAFFPNLLNFAQYWKEFLATFMIWFYSTFCSPGISVYLDFRVPSSRQASLLSATEYSIFLCITYNFHPKNLQHHQPPISDISQPASAECISHQYLIHLTQLQLNLSATSSCYISNSFSWMYQPPVAATSQTASAECISQQ